MELSSTDPIFKIFNDLKSYINDNHEVSIKFHNYTDWTEMEFDNFAKVFRNNYKEIIEDEVLEVKYEDKVLKIFKIANIIKYCNTNNHQDLNHKWEHVANVKKEVINDLFDINLEFNVNKNSDIEEVADFNNKTKSFKLIKQFRYEIGNGFEVVGMMVKTNHKLENDLKKSRILSADRNY
jgi:hypothetical protein